MSDRRRIDVLAMLVLVALIFGSLYLMSEAIQQTSVLADDWFIPLMVFTAIGLITLTGVVGVNLFRLWREYRRREPGVRLNVRLARLFILLSFAPVAIVYFYSWQFLSKGVDSWFEVSIEDAMNGANALGQTALDLHKKGLVKETERILAQLDDASEMAWALP